MTGERSKSNRPDGKPKRLNKKSNRPDGKPSRLNSKRNRSDKKSTNSRRGMIATDIDRFAAYEILKRIDKDSAYSNIAVNSVSEELNVRNKRFVRELVYGVIRTKNLLDFYIGQLVRDGIGSIRADLLILLECGVYQILFMDSVPDHSAVDETVKIAKKEFHGKSGFVNGVLRNFLRKRGETRGDGLREPEDIKDTATRLNVIYSADKSIVKLLIDQYGEDGADKILKASLKIAPLFIRVNTIKATMADILESLDGHVDQYDEDLGIIKVKGHDILNNDDFNSGKFFIQDASSARAVRRFDPKPGEFVIDVCAAPGGKSFGMACRMENTGEIHAFDLRKNRTRLIERGKKALGMDIIKTGEHDASELIEEYIGRADKVLCDVPCSGLGDMSRKPEIRYKDISDLSRLYELQRKILETSSRYVKSGGRIMYSTCSINKLENQAITDWFLSEHEEFEVVESCVLIPGMDSGNTLDQDLAGGVRDGDTLDQDPPRSMRDGDTLDQDLTGSVHNGKENQAQTAKTDILDDADGFYFCIMERKRNS